ncbi:uncharacterized protein [Parasteatoda tepidariorum]|uniref:uncharacterized protein n=1 Tax=Parasteatoda tepidariorum TaxID=114398 RepID=UPI001C722EB7|nr:uncharacterized protein LOC107454070 isoform X1 [Parasteatoda tepidariorum]
MLAYKYTAISLLMMIALVDAHHSDFMMKALLHGASMGMMMRGPPRMIPIPIPFSMNMVRDLFSGFSANRKESNQNGFKRQFDGPNVVVVQHPSPEPKIIVINTSSNQGVQHCCQGSNKQW